ncbi:MAG: methyltransferase domain-containing protein [Candidatus Lokiarchaeota archaeon]|nr:methyltransferase domain-containing protein [Candidatus Lokiarchaeota archaeon]MBD3198545.1 methyltransferase domain-containing protein [Candidatus Lokiarchaeota archaeon]
MEFYQEFAHLYNSLVSFENRVKNEASFFDDLFKENEVRTILDCACGTGHHIIMFKQLGYEVMGSDASPAMLEVAAKNIKKINLKIKLKECDFRELYRVFKNKFDAIVLLGNSLPHMPLESDLKQTLTGIYKLLNKEGILVIEHRNYDRLINTKERFIPISIQNKDIFFYVLDYFENKITFNVVFINTEYKSFQVFNTDYYPILKKKIFSSVKNVGFQIINSYGDYRYNKFDLNSSNHLIIIGKKK